MRGLSLNVRVKIAAHRRRYGDREVRRLRELFGEPAAWSRSLSSLMWADAALTVPAFEGSTTAELRVPCTYDFEVAAAKYLTALADGEVPLDLLFTGTIFWTADDGRLQSAMVPWDREATTRMPVAVWREALRAAFGDSAWLRVHSDVFARLQEERSRRGLTTWEQTLEALMEEAGG